VCAKIRPQQLISACGASILFPFFPGWISFFVRIFMPSAQGKNVRSAVPERRTIVTQTKNLLVRGAKVKDFFIT
jgi:hypothetical protein